VAKVVLALLQSHRNLVHEDRNDHAILSSPKAWTPNSQLEIRMVVFDLEECCTKHGKTSYHNQDHSHEFTIADPKIQPFSLSISYG
jgi:hypothetical protein